MTVGPRGTRRSGDVRATRWMAAAIAVAALATFAAAQERPKPVRLGPAKTTEPDARAVARIEGRSGSALRGEAVILGRGNAVVLQVNVENAPPGIHAIHFHERGDCSSPDALSAGPHWNPTGAAHGQFGHAPYHRGDIGNFEVGKDGKGSISFTTSEWTIGGDPKTDVIGRSIVVHASPDDFTTQPTGNAGARIGCGVVQLEK